MIKDQKDHFAIGIPSVFVIQSPFQALCSVAAIRQLRLGEYRIYVIYHNYMKERHSQILSTLDFFNLRYDVINMDVFFNCHYYHWACRFHHHNRYKRLFVGDFRFMDLYVVGLSYVSDGADIIQIDDGNVTISLLQGMPVESLPEVCKKDLNKIANNRKFRFDVNYLTVYKGLNNLNYNIQTLDLNRVVTISNGDVLNYEGALFVGTNTETFCETFKISEDAYLLCLERLLYKIQMEYPCDEIVYVPHGFDNCSKIKDICVNNNIHYYKAKDVIELEILRLNKKPKAVFGLTSSALYNIKMMIPEIRVVNLLFNTDLLNDFSLEYRRISEYYVENGIELVEVDNDFIAS